MVTPDKNQRMINSVGVGVIIVNSSDPQYAISQTERQAILTDIAEGLTDLSDFEPDANLEWRMDYVDEIVDATPWEGANWPGLNDHFYAGFDAAIVNTDDHKLYAFRGRDYVRYASVPNGPEPGFPRPIASDWHNLPASFQRGIDAALWRKRDKRVYFFKGEWYVVFNETPTGMVAEPRRRIADDWPGMPDDFNRGIDAALMHKDNDRIYFFKGSKYVRFTNVDNGMDWDDAKPIKGNWPGLPEEFHDGFNAALWRDSNSKIYFFKTERFFGQYARLTTDPLRTEAGPLDIGLDAASAEGIFFNPIITGLGHASGRPGIREYADAVKEDRNAQWGLVIFILKYPLPNPGFARSKERVVVMQRPDFAHPDVNLSGFTTHEVCHVFGAKDEYVAADRSCTDKYGFFFKERHSNSRICASTVSMDADYPLSITRAFRNMPPGFTQDLDAVVMSQHGKIYVFKNSQFVTITDLGDGMDDPPGLQDIASEWGNLPTNALLGADFTSGFDAAFTYAPNKAYFFKGRYNVRIENFDEGGDAGEMKLIEDTWIGIHPDFTENIEAAMIRDNGKLYMFKGSQYIRFSNLDGRMDAGYPKDISEKWHFAPLFFTNGLNAAWMRDNHKIYLFKGNEYIRFSNGDPCLMANGERSVLCDHSRRQIGWGPFMTGIDAAVWRRDNDKHYLFSGDQYVRYTDVGGDIDKDYPRKLKGNWKGIPSDFAEGIDAALWSDEVDNKLYFFKGDRCIRFTNVGAGMDAGYPKQIREVFPQIDDRFFSGIDAALWRPSNKKIYLFKDDMYVRMSTVRGPMDETYPRTIRNNWPNLNPDFRNGIDAALVREDSHKIYFFKDKEYVRFTNVSAGVDNNYPKSINWGWMPFPT